MTPAGCFILEPLKPLMPLEALKAAVAIIKSVARDGSQRFLFTIIRIWLLDHPHVLLIELLAVALAYDATHGIAAVNAVDSDALQRVVEHAVLAHHA